MTCSGLLVHEGMMTHEACPECGHVAHAHPLHADGHVSCDVCAVIDAVADALADLGRG